MDVALRRPLRSRRPYQWAQHQRPFGDTFGIPIQRSHGQIWLVVARFVALGCAMAMRCLTAPHSGSGAPLTGSSGCEVESDETGLSINVDLREEEANRVEVDPSVAVALGAAEA
jgi:hypothetical protein